MSDVPTYMEVDDRIEVELAGEKCRYDYRRIYVLLRRGGWRVNRNRTHRLYREVANRGLKPQAVLNRGGHKGRLSCQSVR